MTIQDMLLTEGLRFFKDSKKLYKLALKIENKYHKVSNQETRYILRQTVEKIRNAASQFEKLEKRYSVDKKNVKEEYKDLRRQYVEIFQYIKKQNIKEALVSVGIFAAVSASMALLIDKLDKFLIDNNAMLIHGAGSIPHIITMLTPEGAKKMVAKICKEQNVSFKLVSSIIQKESDWNPNNINHNVNGTYDYGLMQLNSSNKRMFENLFWDKKTKFDIKNPEDNVYVGVKFIKSLLKQYHNDVKKALTAYNAGNFAVISDNAPESTIHYRNEIIKNFKS